MKLRINRILALGVAVALLQSGALYAMVHQHASILRNGTDITLLTRPVDPHDLLRGDYVSLGYAISTIEAGKVTDIKPAADGLTDIYVTVKRGADDIWAFSGASLQKRADLAGDEIQLRGRTSVFANTAPYSELHVEYGIERYYVPEGQGRDIEAQEGQRQLEVVIAVSRNGEGQVRALKVNGSTLYEEPLY